MYSIIIPIFNEEAILPVLHQRLIEALTPLDQAYEVLLVDDGSRDRSFDLMMEIHRKDARFKIIRLSRNFGLDLCQGDAVIVMDGDLQDPPELLPHMIERWKEGYHVVFTVKRSRKENPVKRAAFSVFYHVLHALSSH
jgi:dolichol-phosphate mannosyltransferase